MAERPPFYPLIDTSASNVDINYQNNPLNVTGFQSGQVIPSKAHNTLWLAAGLWSVSLDYGTSRVVDTIDTTTPQQWSDDPLAYTTTENVLVGGASVATYAAYMFDGYRIEIDDYLLQFAGASPLLVPLATAPGRIWVYVNPSIISVPNQPTASIRVESAGVGAAANPLAGEYALVGVDIDGTGVVTGNTYLLSPPPEEIIFGMRPQRWRGTTFFEELATFTSTAKCIDATSTSLTLAAIMATNTSGGPAVQTSGPVVVVAAMAGPGVDVTGNGSTTANESAIVVDGDAGRAFWAQSSGTVPLMDLVYSGTGAAVLITAGAGSQYALNATADPAGDVINAETDSGNALRGRATGAGKGVLAVGGNSAASLAVQGTAGHVDAVAVEGVTFGGANTGAAGVVGTGQGAGTGVVARALTNGYGLIAQSDTTSPTRSAARLVPQDDDPTTPAQGDFLFNLSRNKVRWYTTQWESVHSSDKGWVKQWGSSAAGGPIAGGSGNLSLAQITPEETGDVLVTATGSLEFSVDNGNCTVTLTDVTSALTVATQIERAIDTDGVAPNIRSFVIRGIRTLPNTSTRTFALVITANVGTITYDNVICSVEGVQ